VQCWELENEERGSSWQLLKLIKLINSPDSIMSGSG
jgi:hypothetical protein